MGSFLLALLVDIVAERVDSFPLQDARFPRGGR